METSPRTGVNASKNRPCSPGTIDLYKSYYEAHIKGDPFAALKMAEAEEDDALEFSATMFLSGLRRAEISALRPEDLDWHTPKIAIRRAWQNFNKKNRVLVPPKGKRFSRYFRFLKKCKKHGGHKR